MNSRTLASLFIPILLVPIAVFAMFNILAGGGNQLGNTFTLLTLMGGALGLLSPKAGLLTFVVLQFYVDFFKRLMIIGDVLSMQDVIATLGLGPIIIVAACVSCTLRCLTGSVPFFNLRDVTFFMGCVGVSVVGVGLAHAQAGTGLAAIGQSLLGTSMLGMTAFATYVLIRTQEDRWTMLKYLVVGALPMAMYTIYQAVFGIAGWEEKYIRTGMSFVLYSSYIVDGADGIRPFSTVNTHTSLGAISGALFIVAILLMARGKSLFQRPRSHWIVYTFFALILLASCILSRSRTTYLVPIAGFVLWWMFSGGIRTILFYASSTAGFVWIVANSGWIHDSILDWNQRFDSTAFGRAFGTLGTYQDRFKGFIAMTDSRTWRPFGLPERDRPFVHDQISEILIRFGYIPLTIAISLLTIILFWWHRKCLGIRDPQEREVLISITAITVSLGICSVAYGNMMFVAPVNSLLGLLIGAGMGIIWQQQQLRQAARAVVRDPLTAHGHPPQADPAPMLPNYRRS